MLKNYVMIALRNLVKHKLYSAINILGLAIGLASCLLIVFYVQDELAYDAYHSKADRIYRVLEDINLNGVTENSASMPFPVGPQLMLDYPQIEAMTRLSKPIGPLSVKVGEKSFRENNLFFADSTVFDVFDYQAIEGDLNTALDNPFTIVVTRETAMRYFGRTHIAGEVLNFNPSGQPLPFTVTAVIEDPPSNSHFAFDGFCAFSTLANFVGPQTLTQQWWWNPAWTYIVLPEGVTPQEIERGFPDFVKTHFPANIGAGISMSLQPLLDIHLHSHRDLEIRPNSDINYVYIFSIVALFILMIACINFMNLATARSAGRAREVAIRKVVGAQREHLVHQFLGESILVSMIAVLLGAALCELLLPAFNSFTGKELSPLWHDHWWAVPGLVLLGLLVGIVSGSYPALYLSAFQPVVVLKGERGTGTRGGLLRKTLVVAQFTASIVLLIAAGVVMRQLDFIAEKDLGFNKDHIVLLNTAPPVMAQRNTFKQELVKHASIHNVTTMTEVIGTGVQIRQYFLEGFNDEPMALAGLGTDMDFFETMNIKAIRGRTFSYDHLSDTLRGYVLNETAVRQLGWEDDPIGKKVNMWLGDNFTREGEVIGVVPDFNYASLHQPVEALIMFVFPMVSTIAVRVDGSQVPTALSTIETAWKQFSPNEPYNYRFLDNTIGEMYQSERRLADVILYFAGFAILVACLGLFGLASFTVEQRTKEIGIRKVLGAGVFDIVKLLAGEFSRLVFVAAVIAVPPAWYAMGAWLEGFEYHVSLGWQAFVLATLAALLIANLAVSYKTISAAIADPARALGRV